MMSALVVLAMATAAILTTLSLRVGLRPALLALAAAGILAMVSASPGIRPSGSFLPFLANMPGTGVGFAVWVFTGLRLNTAEFFAIVIAVNWVFYCLIVRLCDEVRS